MRRRQGLEPSSNGKSPKNAEESFLGKLKRLDAYARVEDDLRVRTDAGASLTVVVWVVLLMLIVSEVRTYLATGAAVEHLVVDTSDTQRMRLNVDMTFHHLPCVDLHVDAMDVAGENQIDLDTNFLKHRLTKDGVSIGAPLVEVVSVVEHSSKVPDGYCGPCYGAEDEKNLQADGNHCCNTCDELLASYGRAGWAVQGIENTAEQCHKERQQPEAGEGCRITGFMSVNKVPGNFHMAIGEGIMREGRHIHIFNPADAPNFDVSHTIHRLSFGQPYPGMAADPLDGVSKMVHKSVKSGLFQYYLSIVPTVFMTGGDKDVPDHETNQFSYTSKFTGLFGGSDWTGGADADDDDTDEDSEDSEEGEEAKALRKQKHLDTKKHHHAHGEHKGDSKEPMAILPGVFFVYDLSPFLIEVTPHSRAPISHLLIRLCAVAGGAFSLSGVLDKAIHIVLGKLGIGARMLG